MFEYSLFQDSLLLSLQNRVGQLGCPNVCYIVDVRGTSLDRAEESQVAGEMSPMGAVKYHSVVEFGHFENTTNRRLNQQLRSFHVDNKPK